MVYTADSFAGLGIDCGAALSAVVWLGQPKATHERASPASESVLDLVLLAGYVYFTGDVFYFIAFTTGGYCLGSLEVRFGFNRVSGCDCFIYPIIRKLI